MSKDFQSKEPIEKPWAVYGAWLGATGIGLVSEKPSDQSCYIIYSEGQYYPPELWDRNYVHLFSKLNEATDYFLKNQCPVWEDPYSKNELLRHLKIHFPKAIAQEKKNELTSLVTILSNLSHSQSSPKCTENTKYKFGPCKGCIKQEKAC
jgi:hypothetical protein